MARTRNLKPGFFTNEVLAECHPLARILFAGLWGHADRDGRLEDRPLRFKAQILPYDNCDIGELLNQLALHKFIVRYSVHGNNFIQINTFGVHQNPHANEPSCGFPSPSCQNAIHSNQNASDSLQTQAIPLSLVPSSLPLTPSIDSLDSSEPPSASSEPPMLTFPTNGKQKSWNLVRAKFAEYGESFPGMDVLAECRAALQWCRDNPSRRKTANGMPAFLGRWLSKANDRGARGSPVGASSQHRPGVDIDNLEF